MKRNFILKVSFDPPRRGQLDCSSRYSGEREWGFKWVLEPNVEIWIYIHLKFVSGGYESLNTEECSFAWLAGLACRETFRGGESGLLEFHGVLQN